MALYDGRLADKLYLIAIGVVDIHGNVMDKPDRKGVMERHRRGVKLRGKGGGVGRGRP